MQIFYGSLIPGADISTPTCQGWATNFLYRIFVNASLSVCTGLVLYGFPATLQAGCLVSVLGATRRVPPAPPAIPVE